MKYETIKVLNVAIMFAKQENLWSLCERVFVDVC